MSIVVHEPIWKLQIHLPGGTLAIVHGTEEELRPCFEEWAAGGGIGMLAMARPRQVVKGCTDSPDRAPLEVAFTATEVISMSLLLAY